MKSAAAICLSCGWVHFQVSAAYVKHWEEDWKVFWEKSTPETRANYGCADAPPSAESYLHCANCGEFYLEFRDAKACEIPNGSTIGPILNRNEVLL